MPNSSMSYEEYFCKDSGQMGVGILGDSISAHFHIPEEWLGTFKPPPLSLVLLTTKLDKAFPFKKTQPRLAKQFSNTFCSFLKTSWTGPSFPLQQVNSGKSFHTHLDGYLRVPKTQGYMNSTWSVTTGPTRSTYLNMLNRNRCNHRDYQNVAGQFLTS